MKETLQTGILPVKTRRIFSAVIVLLAVALVFTAPAGATYAWDGTSEDGSWYSNPSATGEFTIQNGSQLYNLSKLVNAGTNFTGKTVKLGADINLNDKEWTPIGNTSSGEKHFNGTFNGSGHTITGLNITNANGEYHGLFGYVTSGGTIQNLHVSGMIDFDDTSSSSHSAGGIAGYTSGTIENCSASVSIEVEGSGDWVNAGGIAGNTSGTIENCSASVSIDVEGSGNWVNAGGIVGQLGSGIIKNCYSYISGNPLVAESKNSSGSSCAGGIAGRIDGGTVQNCYTTGKVSANHYYGGSSYAGGITGSVTGGTIQNCSALNQYVRAVSFYTATNQPTSKAEDGRIYGTNSSTITLTGNYAWDGMKYQATEDLLPTGQTNDKNGASISSNDIWDKLFSPFNDENGWKIGTTETFKLPILKNLPEPTDAADASYLNPTNSGGNSNTGGSGGSSAVILSSTSKYRDSVKAEFKAVTFDANGGIGYMEKQQLPVGEAGELNNNEFTNGGAAFIGWALEPNGPVVYADGEEVTIQGDITLYAVWVEPLPEIPDVPEPASTPAPVLGMMLGGLTAALVLRRK